MGQKTGLKFSFVVKDRFSSILAQFQKLKLCLGSLYLQKISSCVEKLLSNSKTNICGCDYFFSWVSSIILLNHGLVLFAIDLGH